MADRLPATAIVLAGGASTRFGADKLAAELDGAPLLHRAVRGAATVCDEVLVVGPPGGLPLDLPSGLAVAPRVVLDADLHAGPLVALVRGAAEATRERILLLGGDMPDLVPAVLRRLLAWPAACQGGCLVADGWPRPLPVGLDRDAIRLSGSGLVTTGERSLRALVAQLVMERIPEADWRALDPDGRSLRDIDRPDDLATD